jgi:predicted Zn-dependent protease
MNADGKTQMNTDNNRESTRIVTRNKIGDSALFHTNRALSPILAFLFFLGLGVCLAGCASEFNLATERQETLMYGTDKEVSIGDAMARQVEKNFKMCPELDINARVQKILDRLVEVTDRRDVIYSIGVIDEEELNAVSLPGGYIYVFKKLLDKVKSDDELAGVIAHEMGHITARHGIKRLQGIYGYTLLQLLAIGSGDTAVAAGVNTIYTSVFLAYSRQDEYEADELGVKYLKKAGYDPNGMIKVLELLQKENERELHGISYFRTHPYLSERMAIVQKEITGRMDFKGYLNVTGNEEIK